MSAPRYAGRFVNSMTVCFILPALAHLYSVLGFTPKMAAALFVVYLASRFTFGSVSLSMAYKIYRCIG